MIEILSTGRLATLACTLEVSASKPGNVHRGADFDDATLNDFLISAIVLGQVLDDCREHPLGRTIFEAVQTTDSAVHTNTNLGMILLITPLAKLHQQRIPLTPAGASEYFSQLNPEDGQFTLSAICLAKPGGLGTSTRFDVHSPQPGVSLLEAMREAASRDAIARQFVNSFEDVLGRGVDWLAQGWSRFRDINKAIVYAHLATMAAEPDSLITRKSGLPTAVQAQSMAAAAIDTLESSIDRDSTPGPESESAFWQQVADLDFWLRADGRRRNPGTSADLVAASLFAALAQHRLPFPFPNDESPSNSH